LAVWQDGLPETGEASYRGSCVGADWNHGRCPLWGRVGVTRAVAGRLRARKCTPLSARSGRSRNSSLRSSDNHARLSCASRSVPSHGPCPQP